LEQKGNIWHCGSIDQKGTAAVSLSPQSNTADQSDLERAVDEAIAACGDEPRAAIRALIVANRFLESEVAELMKSVSHAYRRGRFHTYSG
jgi:hypothetical protein